MPWSTKGAKRGERALRFRARLIDFADGQEGAAAAQRASAIGRRREMDPIAGGGQHRERRIDILALEIAIESVGEENDLAGPSAVMPGACRSS